MPWIKDKTTGERKWFPSGGVSRDAVQKMIMNSGTVYIGKDKPTDGTLYWLDTSDSETEPETVTYTVTKNLTNTTIDNAAETVAEKSSYAATLTADEGFALSSVTVTMGGADITNAAYDAGNVYIASVTGDIVITAVAVEIAETVLYTITNNLVNVSTSNTAISAEDGTSYTATLTVADGYAFDTVTVTMGGVDITADVYADGVITIEAVTGDVVVTAVGVEKDMTLDESNVISTTTGNELGASSDTVKALDKFYIYYIPTSQYKKTLVFRGRYTSGWSYAKICDISADAANDASNEIVTAVYDRYADKGYVVYEINNIALKAKYQELLDNGTLDNTKSGNYYVAITNGGTTYLLYNYEGV